MNEMIQQLLYFTGSYLAIIFGFYFSINFLSKGWLSCYLKVKASRGKKIMIHVLSKTDTYYKPGHFKEGVLKYKARDRKKQSLTDVKRGAFWYEGGVHHILIDEETGTIYPYAKEGTVKAGITPGGADEMLVRAILAPTQDDTFRKVIFFSLVAVFITLLIVGWLAYDSRQAVYALEKISGVL